MDDGVVAFEDGIGRTGGTENERGVAVKGAYFEHISQFAGKKPESYADVIQSFGVDAKIAVDAVEDFGLASQLFRGSFELFQRHFASRKKWDIVEK